MDSDKIITWSANKVRWVLVEWLNGMILAGFLFFVEQMLFPLGLPKFVYTILIIVIVPLIFIGASILWASRSKGS